MMWRYCFFLFTLFVVYSCKKLAPEKETKVIQEEFPTGSPKEGGGSTGYCVDPLENYSANYDSVEYQTILGNQLVGNPYSVQVMRQAAINLYGNAHGITVNKKYIRFRPADEDQMTQLLELDLELFDYPLNYDVTVEGDYYEDHGIGPNEDSWFKIETVYTDDFGRFQCTKRYRNRVNVFVKFLNHHLRTSGLVSNIGIVGSRIQRSLMPIKRGIGTFSGNLTRIHHLFEPGTNTARRLYRHWWAAQLMNAYLEYNEYAANQNIGLLPAQKLRIILTRWSFMAGSGATPMNSHRIFNGLPSGDYFAFYFSDPFSFAGAFWYNALVNGRLFRWVDMGLGYHTLNVWQSNQVKDLMFHEFAHAAHFNKVGDNYWHDFVFAESFTLTANGYLGNNAPYGLGTDGAISDIISVAESWAEHVAQIFSDLQYNMFPSQKVTIQRIYANNQPVNGLSSHLNAIEDFNPNFANNPFRWIPEGIYYDMFDVRNEFFPVQDNVLGYTNQQFFNALDNDVRAMPQFRVRLLAENGNNQAAQVAAIFGQYNH